MNQYKRLAANTMIFAIGSFGSKILTLFLTKLYTANINPADISTKELLEQTANFLIPIVTFSITDAILRYGLTRNYDKGKIFTSSYLVLGLGVCVMLALSPLMQLLPYTSGYLWLLMLYVFMSSLRSIHSQFVRARGMVTLFAFDGILATITLFIFNVIFIAEFKALCKRTEYSMETILSRSRKRCYRSAVVRDYKRNNRASALAVLVV